jgi:hypothetical protein
MPALPLAKIDVLVIDEIGKNISGTGMDTNIIGRGVDTRPMANQRSVVRAIYVRALTPESRGNAVGVRLADIVSATLVAEMDPVSSYTNAVSAMTPGEQCESHQFRDRSSVSARGAAHRRRRAHDLAHRAHPAHAGARAHRGPDACEASLRGGATARHPRTGASTRPITSILRPTCCSQCRVSARRDCQM